MIFQLRHSICVASLVVALLTLAPPSNASDPLPSWNNGGAKSRIIGFVTRVTKPGSADFVPLEDRIATFDNDGTLWSERPVYAQLAFAANRVKALAANHPSWLKNATFKAAIDGDLPAILRSGKLGFMELLSAGGGDITTDEYRKSVADWIRTAKHPRFRRPYTDLVFQPMLELMDYLRANGFQVWIVSGGGTEFIRVWAPRVYRVPREQIIGSSVKTEFQLRDGKPTLVRKPVFEFFNDKEQKPVGIQKFIGRRPLAAFGNSDGDLQMLQWTAAGDGPRFMMVVHHTDAVREWSYDRESLIGRLDKCLDEANSKGWTVVDMKRDWKVIYPFQRTDHHYFHKREQAHTAHWSYSGPTGPEHWGDLDPSYRLAKRGREQSPIDIRDTVTKTLPKLAFNYKPSRLHLVNNGHTIQENQEAGSFATADGKRFELKQFHFHSPSEHTVKGHQFAMEMHLVHRASDGTVGVVAVLIEEGEENPAFEPIWNNLPSLRQAKRESPLMINVTDLLPKKRGYYQYRGSFTTPPCTEHVEWIVLKYPITLSKQQIKRFRAVIDGNNRPIQPRNGRQVYQPK